MTEQSAGEGPDWINCAPIVLVKGARNTLIPDLNAVLLDVGLNSSIFFLGGGCDSTAFPATRVALHDWKFEGHY